MSYFLFLLALAGLWVLKLREQHARIRFLSEYLGRYQIEKLMELLVEGYLRAAGEADAGRRQQVLSMLEEPELTLRRQVRALAQDLAGAPAEATRFCTLRLALPGMARWWPAASADLRALLKIHAGGIEHTTGNEAALGPRDRNYQLTAEILLLQHSCHWFCRSRTIADGRALTRHQTPHRQLLDAVSAGTRTAYCQLLGLD